jgi:hypothetical protein
MSHSDRTEPVTDETTAKPAGTALVPLASFARRSQSCQWRWAPDPIFITHLIAEAQQAPQTRRMRRASPADAQAAYRTRLAPMTNVGLRTRQVA